ncbi:MAG TPA: hypothetical protein VM493_05065 [Vicinamibacterales bacterium]|nr:hypothetical protein [Vicinamibacterales bacterium]
MQGSALVRLVRPGHASTQILEPTGELIEIPIFEHTKSQPATTWRPGIAFQHQAVMAGLLQPPQVGGTTFTGCQNKPSHALVERKAAIEIGDCQYIVAAPSDVHDLL